MRLRRGIFAFLLMAIYMIASVGSFASVLLCSHDHHHHQEQSAEHSHHDDVCSCEGLSFEAECCDHHHALLGENHTDYIASSQRFDSRSEERDVVIFAPLLIAPSDNELSFVKPIDVADLSVDESWPLVAALISHESLRAPPVVA